MERKAGGSELEMPETFTALTLLLAVVTFGSFPIPAKNTRPHVRIMSRTVTNSEQHQILSILTCSEKGIGLHGSILDSLEIE